MSVVSVLRYGLLAALMVVGATAVAEPDPEGSPARSLSVQRVEEDPLAKVSHISASLNLSEEGLWQIVLSYRVTNLGTEPMSGYSVDVSLQSGASMSQFRHKALAPGETHTVKSLLLGSAVDALAANGSKQIGLIVKNASQGQCLGMGSTLAACNLLIGSNAGRAYCEQKCMGRESAGVTSCVPQEISQPNGLTCTIYVPNCDCEPMMRDGLTTPESLDHGLMRDLLSNPAVLTHDFPPVLESRDIAP
jgi:hypothetical protein